MYRTLYERSEWMRAEFNAEMKMFKMDAMR